MIWIAALLEQIFVVVCFQEGRVALTEVMNEVLACMTVVCKHPHRHIISGYDETVWIAGVVRLGEGGNGDVTNYHRLMCADAMDQRPIELKPALG
jgi:hypothetical protein